MVPSLLYGTCYDCDFPYQQYLNCYRDDFEETALLSDLLLYKPDDLQDEREKSIFYSGCVFSLDKIMLMSRKY